MSMENSVPGTEKSMCDDNPEAGECLVCVGK